MSIASEALLILTNLPDGKAASELARQLVEQRLAACVSILPAMRSIYRWQGSIEEAGEVALLIKTVRPRYAELEAAIRAAHPYDVPEIIAVPIVAGLPDYLAWLTQATDKDCNV